MSMKLKIQDGIKDAMRAKDSIRLDCLRMAKGALLLKEKEGAQGTELADDVSIQVLRAEVKKRQLAVEQFVELGKAEEAEAYRKEIAVLEEFLPQQLSPAQLEERVRAYVAAHPEMNHAGKLTGALKKELGDLADGKLLSETCARVLAG
jgi:uncharacterized protein YqeY